jgi:hypothetical protein
MVRARLWPGVVLLGAAALGAAAPAPSSAAPATVLAHPARVGEHRPGWERARVNETCEACHVEIAAEWRESRHRAAFTNVPFQRSLEREAPAVRPFCQGCHAPEASPLSPPSPLVADMGVGCVTCHAPMGPVLAAPRPGAGPAPHALLRTADFAGDGECAGCHEFPFPGAAGRAGLLMQRTVTEHLAAAEGRTCNDCHMPYTSGPQPHRSHRFPGGHDDAMVRSALEIRAERAGPDRVRVHLTPSGTTHAMPTGDLFRRLAVEVRSGPNGEAASAPIYLARHFTRGGGMHEIGDDRVHGVTRTLVLDAGPGPARVVVRYERVAHHRSPDEHEAEVESAVILADLLVP